MSSSVCSDTEWLNTDHRLTWHDIAEGAEKSNGKLRKPVNFLRIASSGFADGT
jgi:hypothetical protein